MHCESLTWELKVSSSWRQKEREQRKKRVQWEKGERESLVICISIPSTDCAVRQPVCPNKQPAEGGCLIITSPLFSHLEFTFHLTINTRPRLWPWPLSQLEFRDVSGASKATVHMLFSTWWGQYSTRQHPGRGRQKHNVNSYGLDLWAFKTAWCIVWSKRHHLQTSTLHTSATFHPQKLLCESCQWSQKGVIALNWHTKLNCCSLRRGKTISEFLTQAMFPLQLCPSSSVHHKCLGKSFLDSNWVCLRCSLDRDTC